MAGFLMLGLSACFQAFEVCLENRLFMIEPDLTALALQQAVSSWKVILVIVLAIVANIFSGSIGEKIGTNLDHFKLFFTNMNDEPHLYGMMFGLMLVNAMQANLGM